MRDLERTLKALANRRRLAILGYLKQKQEATVGEIAGKIKLSFKATSKHLGILTAADIIEHEQRSLQVYYRIVFSKSLSPAARSIISLL